MDQSGDTSAAIRAIFNLQSANRLALRATRPEQRKVKLIKLKESILRNADAIRAAMLKDVRKAPFEATFCEVLGSISQIDFALQNIDRWMTAIEVPVSASNVGAKAEVLMQPKGVCLIIGPWNYPLSLVIQPLAVAIAAGNSCIIKPSELTPSISRLALKIISESFDPSEVAVFEGDVAVSTLLLDLPFNHIFFTGSSKVGRVVMAAAARTLASVTLELGGKSPVFIDETCDVTVAANQVGWSKLMNAGQTCVAPDYALVHASIMPAFLAGFKDFVKRAYAGDGKSINLDEFPQIVNARNVERLQELIQDAVSKGATIEFGGHVDTGTRTVYPTLLTSTTPNMRIMQEEIFGPILPVLSYHNVEEAVDYVNATDPPLAMYIFSSDTNRVRQILDETTSGNVCVNDVFMQNAENNLPFGGCGTSGIGNYHGDWGFRTFSHERAVFHQAPHGIKTFIQPPYAGKMEILSNRA